MGGQKTLRAYWKNYFEQTDGVVWVVDSTDPERLTDCAKELHLLLQEEVLSFYSPSKAATYGCIDTYPRE